MMEITINLETGSGRVKTIGADGVPHSEGFVGGDVAHAEKLGIAEHVESVWTPEIKADFVAKEEARKAKETAEQAERERLAAEKKAAQEAKALAEQEAFDAAVKAAVNKALAG